MICPLWIGNRYNLVYFTIQPKNEMRSNVPSIHSWVSSFPLILDWCLGSFVAMEFSLYQCIVNFPNMIFALWSIFIKYLFCCFFGAFDRKKLGLILLILIIDNQIERTMKDKCFDINFVKIFTLRTSLEKKKKIEILISWLVL